MCVPLHTQTPFWREVGEWEEVWVTEQFTWKKQSSKPPPKKKKQPNPGRESEKKKKTLIYYKLVKVG